MFVKTPVSWGKRPVKIEDRDGQHSESVTKYRENVTPRRWRAWTCGMYRTRFQARSSVSTKTTLGRWAAAGRAPGPEPAPGLTATAPTASAAAKASAPATILLGLTVRLSLWPPEQRCTSVVARSAQPGQLRGQGAE